MWVFSYSVVAGQLAWFECSNVGLTYLKWVTWALWVKCSLHMPTRKRLDQLTESHNEHKLLVKWR